MQRRREALQLAYRVWQAAAQQGQPVACGVGGLPRSQQPLTGLVQQQIRSLRTAGAGPRGMGTSSLWPAPARQLVSRAAAGPGCSSAAPAGLPRGLQPRQAPGQQVQRGFAAEAAAKPKVQPRSKSLEAKRSLWSGLLLLAPGVLAGFLGKWQLDRRNWKLDLLRRREIMLTGDAVNLFEVEDCPPEYTRVRVAGVFDYPKTVFVGPRARTVMGKAEKGYVAVTPLYNPALNRTVLVNRGWVPASWLTDEAERAKGEPQGQLAVEGVLRMGEQPGEFVPANVPAKGEWYYLNAMEVAQACDLSPDTPLVEVLAGDTPAYREPSAAELLQGKRPLEARPPDEFPLAKSAEELMQWSVMPRDHLNYALTWFTLSGFTTLMAFKAIKQTLRK